MINFRIIHILEVELEDGPVLMMAFFSSMGGIAGEISLLRLK